MVKKNKRGWIEVVEAFLAISILMIAVFIVVERDQVNDYTKTYMEEHVYELLFGIEMNSSLRTEVMNTNNLPLDSNNETFSQPLKDYLYENTFSNSECYLQICHIGNCTLNFTSPEIYSGSIIIFSSQEVYSPKQLWAFCVK